MEGCSSAKNETSMEKRQCLISREKKRIFYLNLNHLRILFYIRKTIEIVYANTIVPIVEIYIILVFDFDQSIINIFGTKLFGFEVSLLFNEMQILYIVFVLFGTDFYVYIVYFRSFCSCINALSYFLKKN